MVPVRVLGVDPSLTVGWALILAPGASLVTCGVIDLKSVEKGRWLVGRRAAAAHSAFSALIEDTTPDLVSFELVPMHRSFKSPPACLAYCLVVTALERACAEAKVNLVPVPAAELKKAATGKGNAKKELVRAAADARWGDQGSDDVGDALWAAAVAGSPGKSGKTAADYMDS